MGNKTEIEWCDSTWNPVTGCDKVSPGCDHCYAESVAHRFAGTKAYPDGFAVTLRPERLDQPLRWKRPRRIFVNSMSDLFHDQVPDDYIARVFAVMALAERHTFQLLTKRHGRMRSLLTSSAFQTATAEHMLAMTDADEMKDAGEPFPLPNLWLGVSAEDQRRANLRIPALLDTPAAVRFISAEPLLGPIDLDDCDGYQAVTAEPDPTLTYLDWVIVGGESGPGARAMHPDWARSLRDQCTAAGVAFLFKQWGEWVTDFSGRGSHLLQVTGQLITRESGTKANPYGHGSGVQDLVDRGHPGWVRVRRAGKKAAGRELDGRTWDEFPAAVSVR